MQFRKEIWQVHVCGSVLEWCLHRESWLCLHYIMILVITCPGAVAYVSTSPIKPGSPAGQKQSETSVSFMRSPIALCTKQPHNKCLWSCIRRAEFLGLPWYTSPMKNESKRNLGEWVVGGDGSGGKNVSK